MENIMVIMGNIMEKCITDTGKITMEIIIPHQEDFISQPCLQITKDWKRHLN